nr:MAG TPA: hypothetical protein [Caudoviricetes sp.]DAV17080.1 MAG TPA: hypothetical protein [Caudoviricetes sp.]
MLTGKEAKEHTQSIRRNLVLFFLLLYFYARE